MARELRGLFTGSVWLILAGALLLRIAIALASDGHVGADAAEYDRYARSIAAGSGYPESAIAQTGPTAFFPPGYPSFLGAVYGVTGDSITAGRLAQAILGTAVVALIGLVCHQLWGRRVAVVAMAVTAIYPPFLLATTTVLSEPLFLVFELSALAAVLEHRNSSHRYRWVLVAGILIGFASLTRANGIVMALPLALGAIKPGGRLSLTSLSPAATLVATAALVLAPWATRNAVEFRQFLPLTTQADLALGRNYNPAAADNPDFRGRPRDTKQLLNLTKSNLDEAEIAERAGSMGRDFAVEHPGYVVETVARNSARALGFMDGPTLSRDSAADEGADSRLSNWGLYSFYAFEVLAIAGALVPRTRQAPWWMWAIPVLLWISAVWLAAGRTRYRLPVDPFIIMLATMALVEGWDRLRERVRDRLPSRGRAMSATGS